MDKHGCVNIKEILTLSLSLLLLGSRTLTNTVLGGFLCSKYPPCRSCFNTHNRLLFKVKYHWSGPCNTWMGGKSSTEHWPDCIDSSVERTDRPQPLKWARIRECWYRILVGSTASSSSSVLLDWDCFLLFFVFFIGSWLWIKKTPYVEYLLIFRTKWSDIIYGRMKIRWPVFLS